jgi:hypothetical protein
MQANLQPSSGTDRYFTETQATVPRNLLTVDN